MQEQLDRIELKLAEISGKVDAAYVSSEKSRRYLLWTGIITAAVIVIPLVILPFVLPAFLAAEGVGGLTGGNASATLNALGGF